MLLGHGFNLVHDFGLYLNPKGRLKQYFQALEILLNQLNG
ncbi:hypothetical protein TV01_0470 [Neisseria flavescens]|nr:hypothetical protein TV01_0470 [Neisseria flavescens]